MPTKDDPPAVETNYRSDEQKWVNEHEGAGGRALDKHDTKAEAEAAGRERAKSEQAEHVIKKKDGTIGEKNSYGDDPRNIPG